jgi:hypothetical protein
MSDTNISGIFILQEVRERILADVWPKEFTIIHNYAWFGAGALPGGTQTSRVERINFNDDTVQASFRGSLTTQNFQGRGYFLTAAGNDFYGWFAGGFPNASNLTISRVDRITFVADSSTASVRGPLSSGRYGLTATSNENFGWFGGGRNSVSSPSATTTISTIDRIDFSVDSATASVRGPLSSAKRNLSSTGNENFGWFGGGYGPVTSTVDRVDFAADTATASVRGPLSSARRYLAATGNKDFGWFGGGGSTSRIDRVDFAADTATASVRGPLSSIRDSLDAAGNINFGWFGGGRTPTTDFSTLVNRITFVADTVTASVRGSLSQGRYALAAVSGFI